jgi:hypothetical protein
VRAYRSVEFNSFYQMKIVRLANPLYLPIRNGLEKKISLYLESNLDRVDRSQSVYAVQFVQLIVSLNSSLDLDLCISTVFSAYSAPEDAGSMFVRNDGITANVHTVLSPKMRSVLKYTDSATILEHSFL